MKRSLGLPIFFFALALCCGGCLRNPMWPTPVKVDSIRWSDTGPPPPPQQEPNNAIPPPATSVAGRTVAVVSAPEPGASLEDWLRPLRLLTPQATVVLATPDTDPSRRRQIMAAIPNVWFTDGSRSGATRPQVRSLSRTLACLYVPPAVARDTNPVAATEFFAALEAKLAAAGSPTQLIVLRPPSLGLDRDRLFWDQLAQHLTTGNRRVWLITGASRTFSAWQQGRITNITLASGLPRQGALDAPAGEFAGLLWMVLHDHAPPTLNVIRYDAILPLEQLGRKDQLMLAELRQGLSATPLDALEPVTKVRLVNRTTWKLTFKAHWSFLKPTVSVLPAIVGFELKPGEVFEQDFRLVYPNDIQLKTIRPELVLTTVEKDGVPTDQPIELRVQPWCRLAANGHHLDAAPDLASPPENWGAPPLTMAYPSQVVRGLNSWSGPADLSSIVYCGFDDQHLYIGIQGLDDQPAIASRSPIDGVDFLLLAAPAIPDRPAARMLQLHLRPDGQRRLLKGPAELADAIKSKVTVTATGYTVTLAIPLEILPADWQQAGVRLDLGLTGTDPGSDGPEALFLSGDGQLRIPDPQRFAIIKSVPKAAP